MTDETIKINREQLREALHNCRWDVRDKGFHEHFSELELALFGPRKPREWTIMVQDGLYFTENNCTNCRTLSTATKIETVRVREVLDGE